jgi:Protein of unknown function (DUF559)
VTRHARAGVFEPPAPILHRVGQEDRHSDGVLAPADRRLAALATRQYGVASATQLRALGFGRGAIERRLLLGRLYGVHRGVYAVGHRRLSWRGHLWAAVLACGGVETAVLSHLAAAALWDLLPVPAGPIDVTSLRRSVSRDGVRVHKSGTLRPEEVTRLDGLPVTTVARTLSDLATVLTPHQLERVCHRAEHLRLLDVAQIREVPGRPAVALRAALATLERGDPDVTRRGLEELFLGLVARHDLPRPLVNTPVGPYEVDFLWPDQRLAVETDGAATHLTPTAFETDRARDADLLTQGYRVARFTWRQVADDPDRIAATLTKLLIGREARAAR